MKKLEKFWKGLNGRVLLSLGALIALGISLLNRRPETNLYLLLHPKYGRMRKLIAAQAKHETGNYTSDLYKRANNLFGIMNARFSRASTQLGFEVQGDRYRHYRNNSESIRDLIDWLENQNFPVVDTPQEYAYELRKRGYYTDTLANYTSGLQHFYNKIS